MIAIFTSPNTSDEQAAYKELTNAIRSKTCWIWMEGRIPTNADFTDEERALSVQDGLTFNAAMSDGIEMAKRLQAQQADH